MVKQEIITRLFSSADAVLQNVWIRSHVLLGRSHNYAARFNGTRLYLLSRCLALPPSQASKVQSSKVPTASRHLPQQIFVLPEIFCFFGKPLVMVRRRDAHPQPANRDRAQGEVSNEMIPLQRYMRCLWTKL